MVTSQEIADFFKKDRSFTRLEKDFGGKITESDLYDTSRWSVYYRYILKIGDQHFEIIDEQPATEMQDDCECITQVTEVEPREKIVIEYYLKPGAETVEIDRY